MKKRKETTMITPTTDLGLPGYVIGIVAVIVVTFIVSGRTIGRKLDKQTNMIAARNKNDVLVGKLRLTEDHLRDTLETEIYDFLMNFAWAYVNNNEKEKVKREVKNISEKRKSVAAKSSQLKEAMLKVHEGEFDEDKVNYVIRQMEK